MTISVYLFATLHLLLLISSPSVFAQNDFLPLTDDDLAVSINIENGEGGMETEGNWENEECYWDETEFAMEADLDLDDPSQVGQAGKAVIMTDLDTSGIAGNSAEEIGAAVAANIDKLISASSTNPGAVVPATDSPNSAIANDIGETVTNAINAVNADPNNINTAIGGAVTQGLSDWGSRAAEIAAPLGGLAPLQLNADQQSQLNQVQSVAPDQAQALIDSVNQAQGAMINNMIAAVGNDAESVGTAIGNAVGDAITQSDNAADAAGNAIANIDQAMKDNGDSLSNAMGEAAINALNSVPSNLTPEEKEQVKANVIQNGKDTLATTTPEAIQQDGNKWTQAVTTAIQNVKAGGDPANQNVVGVINAAADQLVAQGGIV